jgi:hypothetical protein
MWARFAIVLYVFAGLLLIVGKWIEDATQITIFPNSNVVTQEIERRINAQRLDPNNVNPNITLIFGDYASVARILFGIVTGESVFFVLQQLPIFANYYVYLIIVSLYTFSTIMLIVYIIGNRAL